MSSPQQREKAWMSIPPLRMLHPGTAILRREAAQHIPPLLCISPSSPHGFQRVVPVEGCDQGGTHAKSQNHACMLHSSKGYFLLILFTH